MEKVRWEFRPRKELDVIVTLVNKRTASDQSCSKHRKHMNSPPTWKSLIHLSKRPSVHYTSNRVVDEGPFTFKPSCIREHRFPAHWVELETGASSC